MPKKCMKPVRDQLHTVLKKFKPRELQHLVMPVFPEITWQKLQKELKGAKKPISVENILPSIDYVITKRRLKNGDIRTRILELQTIEVSRHNNTRLWYGHSLVGNFWMIRDCTRDEMEESIVNAIARKNIAVELKMLTYEGIVYICIREKVNLRWAVHTGPTYFAIFFEQMCLFCTKKHGTSNYINPIVESLGFQSSCPLDIMGKNLKVLVESYMKQKAES